MEISKIENLTFTYPGQDMPVLESIDLSISQGAFVVVFGESGSGKTTLLRMLKKELTPHGKVQGNVRYMNQPLAELDDKTAARDIGFVMQNPETQIVTDKVWHELAFGLENLGYSTPAIRRRVGEVANYFGIHTWFHDKTTELSGGQKQILNVASIMAMQPNMLVLDEPTSQLDPIAASHFIHTLEKLNRDLGLTIVLAEHRLEEVLALADEVVLLEAGHIICTDSPRHIGSRLKRLDPCHRMFPALPTATQLFHRLDGIGENPLTVREGQAFLTRQITSPPLVCEETKKEAVQNKETLLEVKDAWFRYERDAPDILADVNIRIFKGEVFSVLGGNGSGKSTLMNVMSGQNRPYHGKVLLNHKKIQAYKGKSLYRHNIAVLPQDTATVFIKNTVRKDYEEIARVFYTDNAHIERSITDVAMTLSITHLLDQHPYDVSGGEMQKVALGKILLLKPNLLFLDEPTKGMDVFSKQTLATLIEDLQQEGKTIVVITHDIEFAAMISDRVGLFFDRTFISVDTPTSFFSENNYYTTAASRIARHVNNRAISLDDIMATYQRHQEQVL